MDSMQIARHVHAVKARFAEAAREAARDPGEITQCAATKVQS